MQIAGLLKCERGVISGEAAAIGFLVALGAFMAFNILWPYFSNTTNTLGGKVQNITSTNNPTSW